ncbi:hypothetical protein OROHE_005943 [Orobanche hederae]
MDSAGGLHGNNLPTAIIGAWSAYIFPSPNPAMSEIYWIRVSEDQTKPLLPIVFRPPSLLGRRPAHAALTR